MALREAPALTESIGHGQIVFEGTTAELKANQAVRREWLEV